MPMKVRARWEGKGRRRRRWFAVLNRSSRSLGVCSNTGAVDLGGLRSGQNFGATAVLASSYVVVQNDDCVEMTLGLIAWSTTNNPRLSVSLFWPDWPRVSLLGLGESQGRSDGRETNDRTVNSRFVRWRWLYCECTCSTGPALEAKRSPFVFVLNTVFQSRRWGGQ